MGSGGRRERQRGENEGDGKKMKEKGKSCPDSTGEAAEFFFRKNTDGLFLLFPVEFLQIFVLDFSLILSTFSSSSLSHIFSSSSHFSCIRIFFHVFMNLPVLSPPHACLCSFVAPHYGCFLTLDGSSAFLYIHLFSRTYKILASYEWKL